MRFEGKTFLITGATGAIACATARMAALEGANLVLTDISGDRLEAIALEVGPERTAWLAGDVRDADLSSAAVALAQDRFGGVDVLVPAAGIYRDRDFSQMDEQAWRETMAINLDAVYRLIHAALPALSVESAIVNITSIAAHRGSAGHAHYAATKGALLSLTRSLAQELAPRTRVNAVSPGIIETAMTADLLAERGGELARSTPMKRFGKAEEVADAILFLASAQSSFITGETIQVNGGLYMN